MGFFFTNQPETVTKPKIKHLDLAKSKGCLVCPLFHRTKKSEPFGTKNASIYILGDFPNIWDSEFGDYLKNALTIITDSAFIKNEVRFNVTVNCDSVDNKNPTDFTIECCRQRIVKDIEETKPKVIVGLGQLPLNWCIGQNNITNWRGRRIPVKIGEHTCWFMPIHHPDTIIQKINPKYENEWEKLYKLDLEKIVEFVYGEDYEEPEVILSGYYDNITHIGTQFDVLQQELNYLKKKKYVAIDIETTGLTPYIKNPKILSCAISDGAKNIAFPIEYRNIWGSRTETVLEVFKDFLLNSGSKICHNTKFEIAWFYKYFGPSIVWDTEWEDSQGVAYVLDERSGDGIQSLDSLTLEYLGFNLKPISNVNMDDLINERLPLPELLNYNALDSKYTYPLFKKMYGLLDKKQRSVYKERIMGTCKSLACVQAQGLVVDWNRHKELSDELTEKIENIESEIKNSEEALKFKARYGLDFDYASTQEIGKMFQHILKLEQIKSTKKGAYCTDKEVLKTFAGKGVPLAQKIQEYRELTKLKSTYLDPVHEEIAADGLLHPEFNHLVTSTGRLNSSKKEEE